MSSNTSVLNITNVTDSESDYEAFQEFWTSSPEYSVYWTLKTFVPPFLVLFGCCGNGIVIVALRQHCIRSSSIGYYLTLLISCYIMLLVSTCGLEWISYISKTTLLTNSSDTMCRVCKFVYSVMNHLPYWIVALMLTDRTLYVCFPVLSSTFCTVFVAKLLSMFVFIGLFTINIHMMWTYELITSYGCTIDSYQRDFYTIVWPWVSATANCYLPLLCIHILLVSITISYYVTCRGNVAHNHNNVPVVAATSLTFTILNNPSVILNVIQYSKPKWPDSDQGYATLYMYAEVFQTLVWLNMAVTHIILLLSIPKLRIYFDRLCVHLKHHNPQSSSIEEGSMITSASPTQSTTV